MLEDTSSLDGAHIIWATSWEYLFIPYANNKDEDYFDFYFTALQHILGNFGRGQLP